MVLDNRLLGVIATPHLSSHCSTQSSAGKCLQKWPHYSDCTLRVCQVLDNTALDAIAMQHLGIAKPTVDEGNSLVSTVMAAATASIRFPGANKSRGLMVCISCKSTYQV